jgi:glutamine amidotransferase
MATVAVIDYGMGNIRSVSKALEYVGGDTHVIVSYDPERIRQADRIVLPGVGALRDCMSEIQRLELDDVIRDCLVSKPFLGVCLGMQALMDYSSENNGTRGLGVIPGQVSHFNERTQHQPVDTKLKVPHMGWNQVSQAKSHRLWRNIDQNSRFYFVHSYFVVPESPDIIAGTTDYGGIFTSVIARDNIFAVQFHPEKSQHSGLELLANFMRWDGVT